MIYLQKPLSAKDLSSSTTTTEKVLRLSYLDEPGWELFPGAWKICEAQEELEKGMCQQLMGEALNSAEPGEIVRVAMHPHNNCSVCHGIESGKLDEQGQLEALIPSMRQSAQGTLASLQSKGYEIRKKTD